MSAAAVFVLSLVVSAAIFFVREWLRADWVALPLLVALGVSGVLTPQATLSGFSRSAEGVRVNLRAFALAFLTPLGHPANVLVMGPAAINSRITFAWGLRRPSS